MKAVKLILFAFITLVAFGALIALNAFVLSEDVKEKTSTRSNSGPTVGTILKDLKGVDLENAESIGGKKVEIIKQIRKINQDGSYTVGYEAEDGTFKIESRDVLGNVKGTYGYVDANGEVKRVSYTANNGTGLKPSTPSLPVEDVVHIPRYNRTFSASTSTRRPSSLAYLTSPSPPVSSSTRATVIQAIPKRRIVLAANPGERNSFSSRLSAIKQTDDSLPSTVKDPTTTIVYATSVPSAKRIATIRPTSTPINDLKQRDQIARPDKLEIFDHRSKVSIASAHTKPVTEDVDEKASDEKVRLRGNHLRRQLHEEDEENFETQQQVVYSQSSGDDNNPVYGGLSATRRPIFSTTATPRVPSVVLAARQRAALIQNALSSSTSTTTEKVFTKIPVKEKPEENDEVTESTSENNFYTQSPDNSVQIQTGRDAGESSLSEDGHGYRRPLQSLNRFYRQREFPRRPPPGFNFPAATSSSSAGPRQYRIPLPETDEQEQYLRETSTAGKETAKEQKIAPQYVSSSANGQPEYEQQTVPVPVPYHPSNPYANPYRQPYPPLPPPIPPQVGGYGYGGYPERPLTTRDFERLLQLLVYRHHQYQRYNYGHLPPLNPYTSYGGGGYPNPYSPYGGYPQPPLYNPALYDPRYRSPYLPPVPPVPPNPYAQYSEQDQMYQPAPMMPNPALVQRRRPQYYQPSRAAVADYSTHSQGTVAPAPSTPQEYQQEYLPSDVREDLLYRMLMLAISPEYQQASEPMAQRRQPAHEVSTTAASEIHELVFNSRKPIRSVQILGEDEDSSQ